MTDADYTGLLFIVDASSAMEPIRDAVARGVTEVLRAQQTGPGRTSVDLVTVDGSMTTLATFADPATATLELGAAGDRALFDGIGSAVVEYGQRLAALADEQRPGTVVVVVLTAGGDESSSRYGSDAIRQLIDDQQWSYGWSFVFLALGPHAAQAASDIGIRPGNALELSADARQIAAAASALTDWIHVRKVERSEPAFVAPSADAEPESAAAQPEPAESQPVETVEAVEGAVKLPAKTKLLQVDHLEVGYALTQNYKRKGQRALRVEETGTDDEGRAFIRVSARTGERFVITNDDLATLDVKIPTGSPMDEGQRHLKG